MTPSHDDGEMTSKQEVHKQKVSITRLFNQIMSCLMVRLSHTRICRMQQLHGYKHSYIGQIVCGFVFFYVFYIVY